MENTLEHWSFFLRLLQMVLDIFHAWTCLGHSMGALWMIPAGEVFPAANTSICDEWHPQVPAKALEILIWVKIMLDSNFITSICKFTYFLWPKSVPPSVWDFRCWEPAGTGELTCGCFHRFPMGTCCTPEPVLSPKHALKLQKVDHLFYCLVYINMSFRPLM